MEPEHITLLNELYENNGCPLDKLIRYIEISQIGDHFNYYCFGKNIHYKLVIDLYNTYDIFKQFVDKKDKRTIDFISNHAQLYPIANIIFTDMDLQNNYNELFAFTGTCMLKKYDLDYRFFKFFEKDLYKIFKNNPDLYYLYFKTILPNLNIKEQNKYIKFFIQKHINSTAIKYLLDLNISEGNKKLIKNELFLNAIKKE